MKSFAFTTTQTTLTAVSALSGSAGAPRYLAGGTTLVDLMKLNVEQPTHLIDINGISELAYIDVADKSELKLGSLARMSEVADHPFIKANYPVLSESLWKAASPQLRNMASLGGNLVQRTRCAYFRDPQFACNKRMPGTGCSAMEGINRGHAILGGSEQCIATYPGDWAIALVALDAAVDTLSPRGPRSIPIGELYREPGKTPHIENTLDHDELIVCIRIPATRLGRASTYQKVRDRESYAFALTSAAVALDMSGKIVKDARIAIGGVASRPWRAREAEQSLIGKELTDATAHQAGELAFEGAKTTPQNAFRLPLGINTVVESLFIARQRA
jgi:xanthine dehydrogenase YagS FAD-binding subunit